MIQAAAYWGPEEGPTEGDAVVAAAAMWKLAERLTDSRTWYRTGEWPTRPVHREDLASLFAEGVIRSDDDPPKVMPELGRGISLWDGEDGRGKLSAAVGGTDRTWRGHALLKHPDLPTAADEAWPVLQEMIRIWRPETATWTTGKVRMLGIRAGLTAGQPHLGVLTWVRDGTRAPFTGGDTLRTDGGTLYRFAQDLNEMTADMANRVTSPD